MTLRLSLHSTKGSFPERVCVLRLCLLQSAIHRSPCSSSNLYSVRRTRQCMPLLVLLRPPVSILLQCDPSKTTPFLSLELLLLTLRALSSLYCCCCSSWRGFTILYSTYEVESVSKASLEQLLLTSTALIGALSSLYCCCCSSWMGFTILYSTYAPCGGFL